MHPRESYYALCPLAQTDRLRKPSQQKARQNIRIFNQRCQKILMFCVVFLRFASGHVLAYSHRYLIFPSDFRDFWPNATKNAIMSQISMGMRLENRPNKEQDKTLNIGIFNQHCQKILLFCVFFLRFCSSP